MALINLRNALMTGRRLPYDAEVEYLESTGTQWIDTGIVRTLVAGGKWRIATTVQYANTQTRQIMGAQGGFYFGVVNGKLQPGLGANSTVNVTIEANRWYNISATFKNPGTIDYSVDGLTGTAYNSFSDIPQNATFWFFAANNATTLRSRCKISICKVWASDTLVRDYVPVRKGTVGYLYDRVTRKLFGNAGTGDFVVGPDKN